MKNLTVCIGMLSVAFSCFAGSKVGSTKPSGPAVIAPQHPVLERLAPEIARYQGRGAWFDIVDRAIKYRCKGVQCYKKCCNAEVVKKAHEAGLIVNLFWSNEPEEAKELFKWGIDCLMTDDYQPISFATGVK